MSSEQRKSGDSFEIEQIDIDPKVDPEIQEKALRGELIYAILGLIAGMICVLGGIALIVLGFTGSVEIAFQSGEIEAKLATGSLGIVVVLLGGLILRFTRYRVRIAKSGKGKS